MRRALLGIALVACSSPKSSAPIDAAVTAPPTPVAPDAGVAAQVEPAPPPAPAPCPEPAADPPDPDTDDRVTQTVHDDLTLVPATFDELPGWADDRHAEALPSFLASCARLAELDDGDPIGVDGYSGKVRQWRAACAGAAAVPAGDDAAARAFFERAFRAYAVHGEAGPDGKMTGYFVQSLRASRTRHGAYVHPIHARPPDLVSLDLSQFVKDARGKRIWGRLDRATGRIEKHFTRAEIRRGALDGQGLELLWATDPIDVLFLEIEGSGRAELDDGTEVWLEFDGKNGRGYKGVGKLLRDLGELQPGQGTMPGIRKWFADHPDRIDEILDLNPSKVFFKISERPGAVGTQMAILTPRRSLAIDRAFIAFSTPIWVDTRAPRPGERGEPPWRALVVAQDTGGAIRGAVRGDIYWGADDDAADIGGRMGNAGRYWILLPRDLDLPAKVLK